MFWNVFEPPSDLARAFAEVYRRVLPDSPFSRGTSGGLAGYAGQFDWQRSYTRDEWLDMVPTSGGHSQLPPDKLQELLTGIGAAIDATGGSFTMRYATVVITAARSF